MVEYDKRLSQAIELDERYYLNTFGRRVPFCPDHGDGVWLYGTDGKRYMDMIGGIAVNVVGHARPELTQAICRQAGNVIHCSNYYYNEPQSQLAEKLAQSFGGGRVFICNSGAEANEGAIKLSRGYFHKQGKPRTKIVSALMSFHGRTLAAATVTGQPKYSQPFAPLPEGFVHIPYNDCDALRQAITDDTCAVMLELIQGESGVRPATAEFAKLAAELCERTGARLMIDEIQTGMGRTGHFYAYEGYGIKPDIVTLAKGLAGGVPVGALIANEETAKGFAPGDHGSTFGGNPLACAASLAVLSVYENESLVRKAGQLGRYTNEKLRHLADKTGKINEVRGQGLMIGIELKSDKAVDIKHKMFDMGFLVGSVGANIIRLLPPLIIEQEQIDLFMEKFEQAVAEVL
ncbi:MAG: aspartate aminotransferase family protein [Eubacteriales bacterium]|nr:aspartate aminotransferase family protein [Eubacteriales bacterium]